MMAATELDVRQDAVNELLRALGVLRDLNAQLLEVQQAKRRAMVRMDLTVLQQASSAEEHLVPQLDRAEGQRGAAVDRVLAVFALPPEKRRLHEIAQRLEDRWGVPLREAGLALRDVLRRVAREHRVNQGLTDQSLRHVAWMLRLLTGSGVEGVCYRRDGRENAGPTRSIVDHVA